MPIVNRYWEVSSHNLLVDQALNKPEGWGKSLFWYCAHCSQQYAIARIPDRKWQGISGCCNRCWPAAHPHSISGNVIDTVQLLGEEIPSELYHYQLDIELNFTQHPNHPYNEKE